MVDYADKDTPVAVLLLIGSVNYRSWRRNFEQLASERSFWDVLNGKEEILTKPTSPFSSSGKTATSTQSTHVLHKLDKYDAQHRNILLAIRMLRQYCSILISKDMSFDKDPATIWTIIEREHDIYHAHMFDRAQEAMEKIRFNNFPNAVHYVNAIRTAKIDIEDAHGTFDDNQAKSRLIRGLPARYRVFVENYCWRQTCSILEALTFNQLANRLYTFETCLAHKKLKNQGTG